MDKRRMTAAFTALCMLIMLTLGSISVNADKLHTSSYMYDMLENEAARSFYDTLYTNCEKVDISSMDFEYTPYTAVPDGLTSNEAKEIAFIFSQDHPEYFWLSAETRISPFFGFSYKLIEDFSSGTARQQAKKAVYSRAQAYIDPALELDSDLERVRFFHDALLENTQYEFGDWDQTIASTFLQYKTVCAGFSKALEFLCNACGIDCVILTSSAHAWNAVKLGGRWYLVDVTNDRNSDLFFLISDSKMAEIDREKDFRYESRKTVNGKIITKEFYMHDIDKDTYTVYYDDLPRCPLSYSETALAEQDDPVYVNGELLGDANLDGTLNVRDAAFIARSLAMNSAELLPDCADYNRDGNVNVRDAAVIANVLSRKHTAA